MRKIEKRAIMCLLLAGVLIVGIGVFTFQYVKDGSDWATFGGNRSVYANGKLTKGSVYDINGVRLLSNAGGKMHFNDNYAIRKANVHITGDRQGNIGTSANKVLVDKMIGYNILTGTYSSSGKGRKVNLSIDAKICAAAGEALNGRSGTVGVYNYKTGEIVCLVSSPNYDPTNPSSANTSDSNSGIYMNRFFSSRFIPGSIFKLVTAAAAIETKPDYKDWTYHCTGKLEFGSDRVTCPVAHGTVDLKKALEVSCNCYFGELTEQLGPTIMKKYVEQLGLTKHQDVNGISTVKGKFSFPANGIDLAWAGIGQHNDQLNPCTMMTYMGAIANGGRAVLPKIVHNVKFDNGLPASFPWKKWSKRMIEEDTASTLRQMMRNNVVEHYGSENFPGLNICAKTGTAEVVNKRPNAWFAGFLQDEKNPYAFIILVENGGWGEQVAGSVANTVLQKIVQRN